MSENGFNILVVDDDLGYAQTCARTLDRAGYNARALGSPNEALDLIRINSDISLVLSDLKMPQMDGIEFLTQVKKIDGTVEVIIMTGYGTIESAVRAIKSKALDYITKPFDKDELLSTVGKVHKVWSLQNEVRQLRKMVSDELQLEGFVFNNSKMTKVYNRIKSAARCHCSVFISGESGTGKELIARAIHVNSHRADGPFVPINCSALSSDLIESELFGYKKGAFTGANQDYDGLFVAASDGTLFLDEISEMATGTQAKLLRSIQERRVRPVGAVDERPVNIRFVTATNRSVADALAKNLLREDLYHRLNVIQIEVPPLRTMRESIPELLEFLVDQKAAEHGKEIISFDRSSLEALQNYSWPGNIREAVNIVERLIVEAVSNVITSADLPAHITDVHKQYVVDESGVPTFSEAECDLIIRALHQSKGNKSKAAEILGISRPRLYKKIEQYNIKEV